MIETLKKYDADTMDFVEPKSLDEAIRVLSENGPEAVILAGGLDLVPRLRLGEINPKTIVNASAIEGLDYIRGDEKKGLKIGALTTLRSLELSPVVQQHYMVLHESIRSIASLRRNDFDADSEIFRWHCLLQNTKRLFFPPVRIRSAQG